DILDRPVKAAGSAQPGHVPASRHDRRLRTRKHPAPIKRATVRAAARLISVENLKAAQHPGGLLASGAEGPVTGDAISALDRHPLPATLYGGARDDGRRSLTVDLVHAIVRQ